MLEFITLYLLSCWFLLPVSLMLCIKQSYLETVLDVHKGLLISVFSFIGVVVVIYLTISVLGGV